MSRHRVAVTGLGAVTPAGVSANDFFDRLLAGESFVRLHTADEPPRPVTQPAVRCAGFDADTLLGRPIAGDDFLHRLMADDFGHRGRNPAAKS